MRFELCLALTLFAAGACSDDARPKQDPGPTASIRLDAGVMPQHPSGPLVDPTGMHVDDDPGSRTVAQPAGNRAARDIEITLRSTPPGARVSVDGTPLGTTPAFCNCKADGREHEFLFQLPNHAIARYRFVPVTSGVIHARLDPIAEEPNAGTPPPEVVPPTVPNPNAPQPAPLAPQATPQTPQTDPLPPISGPQP
ncbi:MAG TPA: PEGA domain-containing protein [Kofleriaceae bacterium]|jgi:hypothetical protein|nr:PEGA domain-containing protein [Kofleriaceae bacterium]